jgi:hypothetical protein
MYHNEIQLTYSQMHHNMRDILYTQTEICTVASEKIKKKTQALQVCSTNGN